LEYKLLLSSVNYQFRKGSVVVMTLCLVLTTAHTFRSWKQYVSANNSD